MTLFETIQDAYLQNLEFTYEDIKQSLEYIMDQPIESYCKSNITQEDAEDLAISNEDFVEYTLSNTSIAFESINTSKYAYHLAYTQPDTGTKLLTELKYYQSMGRF